MKSELAAAIDTEQLRYSVVWEDHRLLEQGLCIGPDDEVLSLTSAGDNVLALLLQEPRRVTAVDLSPAQTAVFELKLEAIRRLGWAELRVLLGIDPGPRGALYDGIRGGLSERSRAWLDARRDTLESGLLHAGRLEQYFAGFRKLLGKIHPPELIQRLLELEDPAEQVRFFDQEFATPPVRALIEQWFGKESMARQGRDPAQLKYVDLDNLGAHFMARVRDTWSRLPNKGNPYLALLVSGRYADATAVPPYLLEREHARLRALLPRVEVRTASIEEVVAGEPAGTYSKLNLSDMFEYLGEEGSAALFTKLGEWIRPGGRIAYWNLLVPRQSPPGSRLRVLEPLSTELTRQDRSWFYRAFRVEEATA